MIVDARCIPSGYKSTEAGICPADWDIITVGQLGHVLTGNTPPTVMPENYGTDYPFVSPLDLGERKYISRTEKMLSKRGFSIARQLPRGTVLFVCIGSTIGKCGIAATILATNQQINAIVPHDTTNSEFLHYLLCVASVRIRSLAGEQAVPIVNKSQFAETLVAVPPTLAEQEAIAGALSDADAWIESLEQLIAKKRQIKQGAMQEMLTGKRRLPGLRGEWEVKRLGDVATLYQPTTISASRFTPSGFPVYGANGVVGFYPFCNHDTWQVTVTCRGSTCGTVNRTVERCWITGNAMVVNCDHNHAIDKTFLFYLLSTQDLSICITGTGQPQIVRSPLASVEIHLPRDITDQTAIAAVLSDMDAEIESLEFKLTKARQIKQGMMQVLLTGRIRLV